MPTTKAPPKRKRATKNADAASDLRADSTPATKEAMSDGLMECLPSTPKIEPPTSGEQPVVQQQAAEQPVADSVATGGPVNGPSKGDEVLPRMRTWIVDEARGYCRMGDEDYNRIVVQFSQRPPDDVLTAVKGAGFRFQPDYRGQKNAWVRRNDFEGRLQVEAIEKLIHELIPGPSSPER